VHRDANSPYNNKNKLLAGEISTSSDEELDLEGQSSIMRSHYNNKKHKQLSAEIKKNLSSVKKIPDKKNKITKIKLQKKKLVKLDTSDDDDNQDVYQVETNVKISDPVNSNTIKPANKHDTNNKKLNLRNEKKENSTTNMGDILSALKTMLNDQAEIQDKKIDSFHSEVKKVVDTLKHEHSVLNSKHESFVQASENKLIATEKETNNKKTKYSSSPMSLLLEKKLMCNKEDEVTVPKHVLMQLLSGEKLNSKGEERSIHNAFNNNINSNNNRYNDQYTFPFFGNNVSSKDVPTLMIYSQMLNNLK